jgi:hypothetical protein
MNDQNDEVVTRDLTPFIRHSVVEYADAAEVPPHIVNYAGMTSQLKIRLHEEDGAHSEIECPANVRGFAEVAPCQPITLMDKLVFVTVDTLPCHGVVVDVAGRTVTVRLGKMAGHLRSHRWPGGSRCEWLAIMLLAFPDTEKQYTLSERAYNGSRCMFHQTPGAPDVDAEPLSCVMALDI